MRYSGSELTCGVGRLRCWCCMVAVTEALLQINLLEAGKNDFLRRASKTPQIEGHS